MSWTRTLLVDLSKMARQLDDASVVLRLMMVCNDLTVANAKLGEARQMEDTGPFEHLRWGTGMYFVRLQIGHLNEAMSVLHDLRNRPRLMELAVRCSEHAQEKFHELEACLQGGSQHREFQSKLELVRHKTVFHYDNKLVRNALRDRAQTWKKSQTVTTSSDVRLVRFGVADAIMDTLTVRHIWKVELHDQDRQLDEILTFGYSVFLALMEFSTEFIMRYIAENAASG